MSIFNKVKNFFKKLFAGPSDSSVGPAPISQNTPIIPLPKDEFGNVKRPTDLPDSNHYASKDLSLLAKEYEFLWSICKITDKWQAEASRACAIILKNKTQYLAVQNEIKVPWFFVAVIHYREASLNFNTYLGNGQRLSQVTTVVPKGRGPFNSWKDGAIDALTYQGYANLNDWSLGVLFKRLEAYNGMGYRTGKMQGTTPRNASPYIYSGTEFYTKGRSIEDHSWYPESVDDQLGCMALLKKLSDMGEKIF